MMPGQVVSSGLTLFKARFIYILIFLFPIAGVGVRHWFSGIFVVLALLSLWDLMTRKPRPALRKEEKTWLWLCAGFFITIILSGLVNDWSEAQTRSLGVDIRFLLVVPLYLMLRNYQDAWRWLLAGLMFAAIYLAGHAYYEINELGRYRVQGVYSPNLIGPFAALVALWLLASWQQWGRLRWLLPVLVVAALWVVVVSGSRGAYLGVMGMGLVWSLCQFRRWWRLLPVAVLLLAPLLVYQVSDRFSQRLDGAVSDVKVYVDLLRDDHTENVTGTAIRFEMWHVGWLVFKDNPVFGAGRGNYTEVVKDYIRDRGLSNNVASHSHAHNVYVEVLMSQGLVGFVVFMGVLFYPLYYFFKTWSRAPDAAMFGILHIVGIAIFSLTDASPVMKGNFVVIFLLCLSVFFIRHVVTVNDKPTRAGGVDDINRAKNVG